MNKLRSENPCTLVSSCSYACIICYSPDEHEVEPGFVYEYLFCSIYILCLWINTRMQHHMASHPVRLAVDLLCQGILRYNTWHNMTWHDSYTIRFPFFGAMASCDTYHNLPPRSTAQVHGEPVFTVRRISVQSLYKILYMHWLASRYWW